MFNPFKPIVLLDVTSTNGHVVVQTNPLTGSVTIKKNQHDERRSFKFFSSDARTSAGVAGQAIGTKVTLSGDRSLFVRDIKQDSLDSALLQAKALHEKAMHDLSPSNVAIQSLQTVGAITEDLMKTAWHASKISLAHLSGARRRQIKKNRAMLAAQAKLLS